MRLIMPLRHMLTPYQTSPIASPSYSRLAFLIDFAALKISRDVFVSAMRAEGIPMRIFYPAPLYSYTLFQKKRELPTGSDFPFSLNKGYQYASVHLPFAEKFSHQHIGMEFGPYLDLHDMHDIADAFNKVLSNSMSLQHPCR